MVTLTLISIILITHTYIHYYHYCHYCMQALLLLNLQYVLPAQELSERVNFACASLLAAGLTAGAVAFKVL